MIKKIITGIIITAFLTFGAAGSIYAYQKEQEEPGVANTGTQQVISAADSGREEPAVQPAGNNSTAENRYQYNNNYRKNENNNNCEAKNNCYSHEYNYNHKNENCGENTCLEYNYSYRYNRLYQNCSVEKQRQFFRQTDS